MSKALYICYFGVREPLVQTQVIPYLQELVKGGYRLSLLTFEPAVSEWRSGEAEELRTRLAELGIDWFWLRYHKRFSAVATAWDVFCGSWFVWRFIGRERPDILHGRAYVPTLIGALARKFSRRKPKLLFDIRGFMPEEYTDAGIWPEGGWLFRVAKQAERWLLRKSDGFVVLTEKAREIHFPESKNTGLDRLCRPVAVIPCCVDMTRFDVVGGEDRSVFRADLGLNGRPVMAYVGSFGGWYLSDEMMEFAKVARTLRPDIFFLVLTQRDQGKVRDELIVTGFTDGDFLVKSVRPQEIGKYLCASDFAISFIKPCYSKLASSPTKLAEYLACGLPVVANSGVGDVDELIAEEEVGVIFNGFDAASYRSAFEAISAMSRDAMTDERCRRVAHEQFDLVTVAGVRYRRLYSKLLEHKNAQ